VTAFLFLVIAKDAIRLVTAINKVLTLVNGRL